MFANTQGLYSIGLKFETINELSSLFLHKTDLESEPKPQSFNTKQLSPLYCDGIIATQYPTITLLV